MNKAREKLRLLHELIAPNNYFALLICLCLLTLLSAGTIEGSHNRFAVAALAFSVVISVGVAANTTKKIAVGMWIGGLASTIMLITANVFAVAPFHGKFIQLASYAGCITYLLAASLTILKDVFTNQVNTNRICGAICFYVLVGMTFGMFFFALDAHDPTSFKIDHFYDGTPKANLPISTHDRYTLFNYFSFCTLTTAGLGDISPVSQTARTFAWLEAVFGQLYLSILVARLVGLHIAGATNNDTRPEEVAPASGFE